MACTLHTWTTWGVRRQSYAGSFCPLARQIPPSSSLSISKSLVSGPQKRIRLRGIRKLFACCCRCFHADCALEPTGECPKLWTCRICAPKPNQNGLMNNVKRGGKFALVRTSAKLKGRTGGGRDSMPNSCDNGSLISATEFGQNQLLKKRQNHLEELLK